MRLFFDTETTGKADFKAPPDAPHQPRLVQLAAILAEDDGKEIIAINLIIKPDGFEIPTEASEIHGITTEKAMLVGVQIKNAMRLFRDMWNAAQTAVAHSLDFDSRIIDGEMFRAAGSQKPWGKEQECFCTMHAMTPFCKLPGNYGDYKWPKLIEAYRHAFGKDFDGAHDAMVDVRACKEIYFWLVSQRAQ